MHADEAATDVALVRRLIAAQFPQWDGLPVQPVPGAGTENALFRLGDDLVVRLPRVERYAGGIDSDLEWLPRLAPRLPVAVPMPVAKGVPSEGYPWAWGVYSWLPGESPDAEHVASDALAADLTGLVSALRGLELDGPPAGRAHGLAYRDEATRAALVELQGTIDTAAALAAWEDALAVAEWAAAPVWIHGDLLPTNLLVEDGRLTGVLDWGGAGLGDPAVDMLAAWGVLDAARRKAFRDALGIDDETWARGRGWALTVGVVALPYYTETNPWLAAVARRLIREVLDS